MKREEAGKEIEGPTANPKEIPLQSRIRRGCLFAENERRAREQRAITFIGSCSAGKARTGNLLEKGGKGSRVGKS